MTTIFMFHQIADRSPAEDPAGLAISPQRFRQQMAYLARAGYRCVSLREAIDGLLQRRNPRKTFALTFDDGFQDTYSTAWPILDQYGFTATVFVVVGCVGQRSDWPGQSGAQSAALMTWEQIRELAGHGFSIGSHTLTHPRLSTLPPDRITEELTRSKHALEAQLGAAVELFSYPYSDRTPEVRQQVAAAGYWAACASDRGPWDRFNVWRMQCWRTTSQARFILKAQGWDDRVTWLREDTALGAALKHVVRRLRERRPHARGQS